jgi:hypothetical protein
MKDTKKSMIFPSLLLILRVSIAISILTRKTGINNSKKKVPFPTLWMSRGDEFRCVSFMRAVLRINKVRTEAMRKTQWLLSNKNKTRRRLRRRFMEKFWPSPPPPVFVVFLRVCESADIYIGSAAAAPPSTWHT